MCVSPVSIFFFYGEGGLLSLLDVVLSYTQKRGSEGKKKRERRRQERIVFILLRSFVLIKVRGMLALIQSPV